MSILIFKKEKKSGFPCIAPRNPVRMVTGISSLSLVPLNYLCTADTAVGRYSTAELMMGESSLLLVGIFLFDLEILSWKFCYFSD